MPLNGRPSHTRLGKIHFQRIAALSARDLGNHTKSRSFQCRANRRSLRKAQWKLIHTEISYRAPEEKRGVEKKSYRKAPTREPDKRSNLWKEGKGERGTEEEGPISFTGHIALLYRWSV
ncbi:uncharacterized [Tachysurus ichikawai]